MGFLLLILFVSAIIFEISGNEWNESCLIAIIIVFTLLSFTKGGWPCIIIAIISSFVLCNEYGCGSLLVILFLFFILGVFVFAYIKYDQKNNKQKLVKKKSTIKKPNSRTKFDNLFYSSIRERGYNYYLNDKIKNITKSKHKYIAIIDGSEKYSVSIKFNDMEDEIIKMNCDCPYHLEKGNNCKHMYALLCKVKEVKKQYEEK